MRTLAAAVLGFEAVVVVLVVPVAITLGGVDTGTAVGVGVAAFVGCILTAALLRHRWAYVLGSVVQVFLVACGLVIPAMFVLGGLFAALWVAALLVGRRGDELRAHRYAEAGVVDPGRNPSSGRAEPAS